MGKNHSKGLVKGTILGAVLGGIAALLLAPKSGKETQADIKKHARKVVKNMDDKISELEEQLTGRIDDLKDAAKELKGEAYEDSQRLITRAEILKADLRESADALGNRSKSAKDETVRDAKRLVTEGGAVLSELESMTKHVLASAKDKVKTKERAGSNADDEEER